MVQEIPQNESSIENKMNNTSELQHLINVSDHVNLFERYLIEIQQRFCYTLYIFYHFTM